MNTYTQCIRYILLHNKLPVNLMAWNHLKVPSSASSLLFYYYFSFFKCTLRLHWVLVVSCGIFSCGTQARSCSMQDLVPRPPTLGAQSLSHRSTREVPATSLLSPMLFHSLHHQASQKLLKNCLLLVTTWPCLLFTLQPTASTHIVPLRLLSLKGTNYLPYYWTKWTVFSLFLLDTLSPPTTHPLIQWVTKT